MKLETVGGSTGEVTTQDLSSENLHVLDLLITLSRRRRFIFWFTAGVTILTVIAVLVLPSRYTASTLVLPPGQNSSMSSALLGQLGGSGALASLAGSSLGIKNPSEVYISLLRSRTVENSLIQRFGLMARYHTKELSDTRAAFEANSKVVLGAKDGLITVSVTDKDPSMAANIANGYIDEFRKSSANLAITEASQRRSFFQQQLLESQQNLVSAEEALKKTEQSTGVLQIDSQTRSLIESAASLRAQIVAKEVQLQGMRSYATEDNPEMVEAKQQLAALQAQLAKLVGGNQDTGSDFIVPKGRVPEAAMEYIRKLRDVKYYEAISELIAKQFEMAKLDEARQGSIIQVVDPAVPPEHRSFPKRTITVLLAMLLSFFAACAWSLISNGFQRANHDPNTRQRLDALRAAFRK
ncbi:MAG: Wzz/FepE/Etk N-terminal domain-containing protein [Terracidiphilus sp.]|nr:Wzz/FepE/Etk N-terminal domain-containing protein [Terracidiphilus sp.]